MMARRLRPSTAARLVFSCRTSTFGKARSGSGSSASWTGMSADSGNRSATTTTATRGANSATTVTGEEASVRLTPREVDKLVIFTASELDRRRRARGLKLNHPEAVVLIIAELLELIRD